MLESKAFSEKALKIFKICAGPVAMRSKRYFWNTVLALFFKNPICAVKWILEGVVMRFYMLTDRYLCVNDALHHWRPPMRGLKHRNYHDNIHELDCHFRTLSPLRGLKPIFIVSCFSMCHVRILSPLRGPKRVSNSRINSATSDFRTFSPLRGQAK